MSDSSIEISGLEKIYQGTNRSEQPVHALKPLQLKISRGEVFGLLGPNGAGKTTLVKLLLGIVFPTSGTATILNQRAGTKQSKEVIGYLPESHRYPSYLTGEGVLQYFGRLSGIERNTRARRIDELLELVDMSRWRKTRVKKYSKGMMQRLGIAQALLNDPSVVFLDEPTDGVDPVGRKEIREIILRLREEGKTIFLNSHLLSEVELISDRVAILNRGEMVRIGTVPELTRIGGRYRIEVSTSDRTRLEETLAGFMIHEHDDVSATIAADHVEVNRAIDLLRSQGITIIEITPVRRTLEDLFIDIVEQEARLA